MSLDNHSAARSILFLGAQSLSRSPDGAMSNSVDFSKLYHTWAVCEWHLNNLDRAETLFDHALRLTNSGEDGSQIRSLYLYSIARFLFHARDDCTLAQHCISLSLSERSTPNLTMRSEMWNLWEDIATKMGNTKLAINCKDQTKKIRLKKNSEDEDAILDLKRFGDTGCTIQQLLRKAPWHHKIVHHNIGCLYSISWYRSIPFPPVGHTKIFHICIAGSSTQKLVDTKHTE